MRALPMAFEPRPAGPRLLAAALGVALVAACSAAPNPARSEGEDWRYAAPRASAATDAEALVGEPEPESAAASESTAAEPAAPPTAQSGGSRTGEPGPTPPAAPTEAGAPAPGARGATGPAATGPAGTSARPDELPRTAWGSQRSGLAIGSVAGEPIDVTELLALWMHQAPREVLEVLDQITMIRLVLAEAQRLGVRLDPRAVAEAEERALAEMEADVQRLDPTLDLDRFLSERRGQSPERYRQRHRYLTIARELTPLVVRAWTLGHEHARVRLLAVEERARLAEVRAALDGGLAFEEAARRWSAEPDEAERGRARIVPRNQSTLARMVFATPAGTVGGPFEEAGAYLLVLVEDVVAPRAGTWAELGPAVRESLAALAIDEIELLHWREAMRERYAIERLRLLELVGEIERRPADEPPADSAAGPRD